MKSDRRDEANKSDLTNPDVVDQWIPLGKKGQKRDDLNLLKLTTCRDVISVPVLV